MCVVIDTCAITKVFNEDDAMHALFKPVRDWIIDGSGRMVVGGSRYQAELAAFQKLRKLFVLLRGAKKIIKLSVDDDAKIDQLEQELKGQENHNDFDDPHIVALLVISGCLIVCTSEQRAIPFLKRTEWYKNSKSVPKVYGCTSVTRAKEILCCKNIADICKPSVKLTKKQIQTMALAQ